jgi:hypothetical protein
MCKLDNHPPYPIIPIRLHLLSLSCLDLDLLGILFSELDEYPNERVVCLVVW